jgi:hypothetical protein
MPTVTNINFYGGIRPATHLRPVQRLPRKARDPTVSLRGIQHSCLRLSTSRRRGIPSWLFRHERIRRTVAPPRTGWVATFVHCPAGASSRSRPSRHRVPPLGVPSLAARSPSLTPAGSSLCRRSVAGCACGSSYSRRCCQRSSPYDGLAVRMRWWRPLKRPIQRSNSRTFSELRPRAATSARQRPAGLLFAKGG